MDIELINPSSLSAPTGYSHVARVAGATQVFVSGQVALDVSGRIVGEGDLEAQAQQVYQNVVAALASVGADFSDVVKLVTYVVDLTAERAGIVRSVRGRFLGDGLAPASTMVGVTSLVHPALLIEIEAHAVLA